MGRPRKTTVPGFEYPATLSSDPRVAALREKTGIVGYGTIVFLMEHLCSQPYQRLAYTPELVPTLAGLVHVNAATLKTILVSANELGLLTIEVEGTEKWVRCPLLDEQLVGVYYHRQYSAKKYEKQSTNEESPQKTGPIQQKRVSNLEKTVSNLETKKAGVSNLETTHQSREIVSNLEIQQPANEKSVAKNGHTPYNRVSNLEKTVSNLETNPAGAKRGVSNLETKKYNTSTVEVQKTEGVSNLETQKAGVSNLEIQQPVTEREAQKSPPIAFKRVSNLEKNVSNLETGINSCILIENTISSNSIEEEVREEKKKKVEKNTRPGRPKKDPPPDNSELIRQLPSVEPDFRLTSPQFLEMWQEYKLYRWEEKTPRFQYASWKAERDALLMLNKRTNGDAELAVDAIRHTKGNGWLGLQIPDYAKNGKNGKHYPKTNGTSAEPSVGRYTRNGKWDSRTTSTGEEFGRL